MDMLSDQRSDDYGDWYGVGRTLFDIGEGCDEAFNMWVDFSKRSVKFVEGTCEDYWGRMELGHRTLGSLLYLAKIDSPKDYKEFQQTSINHNLWQCAKCLRPNEYAVAQVVVQMFQNRFKCVDAKRDIWYEYRGHKWVEDDGSLSLRKLLANEVYDTFVTYERDLLEEKRTDKGDTEAAVLQKKIWAYQEKLRTGSFEKQVVDMCKLEWYDKDFYKNINENRSLIGCENGVIDLELGVFRDGQPDDYITFSTGLNFNKDYTYDHPDVKDLDKYLLEVFPNKNRREYFLDFLCATLQGNDHKRFLVATGDGDNSKSMMMALLEETFGLGETGYYGKFPPELVVLSKGHSSGQCRPELSRVRGKKIMGIDEITDQQQLNIMEIKRLTGNDSYYARAPFEKGTEIKPQFTLILQCNDPPKVPGNDTQTWNRIRVLDFESKFVIHSMLKKFPVPKTRKEQIKMKRFPADPQFKKRLPELAPALLWKTFDRYKDFKERGLIEPKEVLMATDMYKASNDIFMQFVTDRIEKIDDEEEAKTNFIRLQEAYSEFKEWYRENYPSYNSAKDKAGCATLKSELIKRLGVKQHDDDVYGFGKLSRFYGYKMAEKDEVSGFGRSNVSK
jgi:phage/plasmid-associated DNA primase